MVRIATLSWVVLLLAGIASPAGAGQQVPGRLLLELTDEGGRALRAGTLQLPLPPGGEALRPRMEPLFTSRAGRLARFALVTFDPPADAEGARINSEWLESLGRSPRVLRGESDWVMELASLPTDPYFLGDGGLPRQFHLHNAGGLSLRASRAWPFVPADREVVVGIIDSGVRWQHADLGGGASPPDPRVFWHNAAEVNGAAGVDDDANGKIDDFIGWDFVEVSEISGSLGDYAPVAGEDAHDPDNDPTDQAGHGTEVAGFVNALTGNGQGIAGAAPVARIMPLRAGWLSVSGQPVVYMSFCARAVEYAALNGAGVLNCSWDSIGDTQYGLAAALDEAIQTYDVVVVGSAGNLGTSSTEYQYLASREDCLGVAGVLASGVKASGSNFGSWVDLAAFYTGPPSTTVGLPGYRVNSGTSFSAPQVAAAAALVRAVAPWAPASMVRDRLKTTAQDISALNPQYALLLGSGLVDYAAAVRAAGGGWDAPRRARGLTAFSATGADSSTRLVCVGDTLLQALDAGTGLDLPAEWSGGVSLSGAVPEEELPLALRWPSSTAPLLVWREGASLRGHFDSSRGAPGWPVPIEASAGQPAASPSATMPEIFLPSPQGLLVIRYDALADTVTERFPFACTSVATGQVDAQGPVDLAAMDAAHRVLHLHLRDGGGGSTSLDLPLGLDPLPPVIGEFWIQSAPLVLAAFSVESAPSTRQEVRWYQATEFSWQSFTTGSVVLDAPPLTALSLAGFAADGRVAAVAADSAGGIHLIRPGTAPEVLSVDAGGPIAGEVLCADLDGDAQSDLIALRRDGTLLAYRADLTLLPGFPRRFPFGAAESPIVTDAKGLRSIVVADTAGGLWSLPMGPAGGPAPWPTARGDAGRSGFLGFERATPIQPAVSRIAWEWRGPGGDLCWTGLGMDALSGLRLREVDSEEPLWSGAPRDEACAQIAAVRASSTLVLEGLDRAGGWFELGRIAIPAPGLWVAAPQPNPFLGGTRIVWSGAGGPVRIALLDARGRLLREARSMETAGAWSWDGTDATGRPVAAGIYFIRVSDGEAAALRRLLRLR